MRLVDSVAPLSPPIDGSFVKNLEEKEEDEDEAPKYVQGSNGLIWKKRAFFQETAGDETAFLFEADGSVLAVGRHGGGKNAQLLRSKPP